MNSNKTSFPPLFSEFPPADTHAWESIILKDLKGGSYEKKLLWNPEGSLSIKPYYRSEDLLKMEFSDSIPGAAPFVRGYQSDHNDWTIREDISESKVIEANLLALDALKRGVNSLGLSAKKITKVEDLSLLLKDIDIRAVEIHFTSAVSYPKLFTYLQEYLNINHIDANAPHGSFNFDFMNWALIHGKPYSSVENDEKEAFSLMKNMILNMPNMKAIVVNGHVFKNAGASIVQELAYSLASGNEYLYRLTSAGLKIDEITPHLQFTLGVGSNYFLEIAKFRAFRVLWSAIVNEYSPTKKDSLKTSLHAISSTRNKTLYDPYVNMLRITTETLAASIGGAHSISVSPFDATYASPSTFSRRVATNTQIVIKEEAYLNRVIDPGSGSYYIENLTDIIAKQAWELFLQTEEKGGFLKLVLSAEIKKEIEATCQKQDLEIATKKMILLGTNQYANLNENMLEKIQWSDNETKEGLSLRRGAEDFEKLRLQTETYEKENGKRPVVFMLTFGDAAMRKARASFSANFFACAGYKIIENIGFETTSEGVEVAIKAAADIVVICSSDLDYTEVVPKIAGEIKILAPQIKLILAGYPKDQIENFRQMGVDDFIHIQSNLLETLQKYNSQLLH